MLSKQDALNIAHKLEAEMEEGRKHRLAKIHYAGKRLTSFGISRSPRDSGHGHIPRQLFVTQKSARDLSQCRMSKDAYFQHLIDRGVIEPPAPAPQR